ncbi:MAG TPA: prepilin-type N-terminal cleavage/methylation domain-containing protein [Anaeromyxobacteraceae bacterium]|nr:prepilin-type N-terminal cleavage/methylation domain-containing protein [Anaeromyxobacteraceae bacterium]
MRTPARNQRGTTLLEALVAMTVLLVGAAGMLSMHMQGVRIEGDARRITRATAIAQDLMDQIALWPYTDPRLANSNGLNDATYADPNLAFEAAGAPPADHGEADLTLGSTTWFGIPALESGYERYWNVAYVDDANGNSTWDAVRVAVIVRWRVGTSYRRVVLIGMKANPLDAR